ncbi:MAG: acyltransferase family protein [Corynebacterium sp.]|uniref:acyltransferase family protein n=1 Tax=Corynebacterium sp. TaxID=1720 RepID=UPI0026DCBC41|nr:acyltransferase family protein [Corynebacterium sp.]MDO4761545.1 acyltransferase family protein [Corynebacterium sp.]
MNNPTTEQADSVTPVQADTAETTAVATREHPTGNQVAQSQVVAPKRYRIRRVPAIDGLRGLAVLVVVLYHYFGDFAPGGFLGVDMFFVLSGFLITSLLIREHSVFGRVNLKQFWVRRIRRIVPAAVVVLVIGTAVAGLVGGDPSVKLGSQFFGTLLFANNWVQIAGSQSYFADSGVQIFAHYWSLAVEEQFYVLWPLIFVVVAWAARGINAALKLVVLLVGAGSFAAMLWMYDPAADPTRVYYGTDTHSFGLLIGVSVALWLTTTDQDEHADSWPAKSSVFSRFTPTLGVVALLGLLVMVGFVPDTAVFTYRGGLLLASFLTAVLLVTVVREVGPAHSIMSAAALRWIGERSFSLYLWHWPVFVVCAQLVHRWQWGWDGWLIGAVSCVISFPLAHLSYMWVETPVRRRGYASVWRSLPQARRKLLGMVMIVALVLASVAMLRSPKQTQLEQELEAIAAARKLPPITAIPAADSDDVATAKNGPQLLPKGSQITAIGDSVMLGSKPALEKQFDGIYVDAAVSRNLLAAPQILQQLNDAEVLDPFVVLGFGTNAELNLSALETSMNIIGTKRVVVLVMPFGDRSWIPGSHKNIREAVQKYPNVYVANWCAFASKDSSILHSDLIHPNEKGVNKYAESIQLALKQWANHRKTPIEGCVS